MIVAAETYVIGLGGRRMPMQVVSIRDTLIAWYERRAYGLTGEWRAFPYGDPAVGEPQRDDLEFVLLERRSSGAFRARSR
jgi:hypothetical protein